MDGPIIPADGGMLNCADGLRFSNGDCSELGGRALDIWRISNGRGLTPFIF